MKNSWDMKFSLNRISKVLFWIRHRSIVREWTGLDHCMMSSQRWNLTSVAEIAPVEDPEAKVRILVESAWLLDAKFILTRSKWCLEPTRSRTRFELEGEEAGCWPVKVEKRPLPHPLSSWTGLLLDIWSCWGDKPLLLRKKTAFDLLCHRIS